MIRPPRKSLPDFFVLGVAKGGTTSFHHYLRQHPCLYLPYVKELHFFDAPDDVFAAELGRYLEHFADAGARRSGEATPSYFRHVEPAAGRIRDLYGDAPPRFLLLLRDPVQRAYSHYLHNVSEGREAAPFGEALEAERAHPAQTQEEWKAYFRDGMYAETLAEWLDHFPGERFLVLLSAELEGDTDASLRRTFRFLDVDPGAEIDTGRRLNRTGERQSRVLGSLLSRLPVAPPSAIRRWLPRSFRLRVDQFVRRRSTGGASDRPSIDPGLERRLRRRYAPHIRRLSETIDRDLSAWLPRSER